MADLIERIVKDQAGVPVNGALVYVYADGALAALKDALGGAIANPMVSDQNGYVKGYVTYLIEYTVKFNWGGKERYVEMHRDDGGIATAANQAAASASAAAASAATAAAATNSRTANTTSLISGIRNNAFFPQASYRCASNDVATITQGPSGGASAIPGFYAAGLTTAANKVDWLAGPAYTDGSSSLWPRGAYKNSATAAGGRSILYSAIEFNYTSDRFEVALNCALPGQIPNFRVFVNDKLAGTATIPTDFAVRCILVQFPTSATRRIRIETCGGYGHYGINATSSGAISRTGRTYPLWSVIGDSFAEGTGANYFDGEAVALVRALGGNINLAAVGGTGIISPGIYSNWTATERLRDLALNGVTDQITGGSLTPNGGIIMMSVNDNNLPSSLFGAGANFQEAVTRGLWTMVDHWKTNCPGKPLVVFGPTWPNETPTLDIYRIRDAGQQVCAASQDVWFIDRLGPGPILRKGNLSSLASSATLTSGSKIITGISSTASIALQASVIGTGIPAGARVMSIDSGTQVTLDLNASVSGVQSLTFRSDQTALYTTTFDTTHPSGPDGHTYDGLWMAARLREIILTQLA